MAIPEVRRPKFDFTGDVPWEWNPANPQFSFFMNATSMIAICSNSSSWRPSRRLSH